MPSDGNAIDRRKPLNFNFNGKLMRGYQGDSLASALLANGVTKVARSIKYRRFRGIMTAGVEEPNAIVQLGFGSKTAPNYRATEVELVESMYANSVNAWPSLDSDFTSLLNLGRGLLSAGFYYKTFMWPEKFWPRYEHLIRKMAGFGKLPEFEDPDHYQHRYAHCDVLIVGGGPTGLMAAKVAAQSNAKVMVCEQDWEWGGQLHVGHEAIDGQPASEWLTQTIEELRASPNVTLLSRCFAYGYYDHNCIHLLQRRSPLETNPDVPHQRLWIVRAKSVVFATGAFERPMIFKNNDLPNVMTAHSIAKYIHRFGVVPGNRLVVFTNNNSVYPLLSLCQDAGMQIPAIVDTRTNIPEEYVRLAGERGVNLYSGWAVTEAVGRGGVEGVEVRKLLESNEPGTSAVIIDCDLLATSNGWNPAIHLHSQSGGSSQFDPVSQCFVPGPAVQNTYSAGGCNGQFQLYNCFKQGAEAALMALKSINLKTELPDLPQALIHSEAPIAPMWYIPQVNNKTKMCFVDIQNDTTVQDLKQALVEGYESIEHVKRYTLLGFGTDQGKLGNVSGAGIVAQERGLDIAQVGLTTFRPPYHPVPFGALAGHQRNRFFEPIRYTAMQKWHENNGAVFEDVGQWKRPRYYPLTAETMDQAVARECLAVRQKVGIMDASTLGKIDIHGPDAGAFLDQIYTNAFSSLKEGRCRYGLMLNQEGMVMDDGVTTRLSDHHYFMTTTTGGAATVMSWLEYWHQTEWPNMKVSFTSCTDHWAVITLAGPMAMTVLQSLQDKIDWSSHSFPFMSVRECEILGLNVRVFRVSFSGELSYEIHVNANYAQGMWDKIIEAGRTFGIVPYGTETMHVLRAEKGYIIVGQETDGTITPLDLGMEWMLSKKKDYIGRRSLARYECQRRERKQLVGLKPLRGSEVLPEGAQLVEFAEKKPPIPMIGHVTSSYYSACLGHSFALGLVQAGLQRKGHNVYARLRSGQVIPVQITDASFYDPKNQRQQL